MNNTFKHSGDMGDIIYSLPTIKMLGGGILYLDVTGGEDEPICRAQCIDRKTKFNQVSYDFIKPLLEEQSYIKCVEVYKKNQKIDYNLNNFRTKFALTKGIVDMHTEAFGVSYDINNSWLSVDSEVSLDKKTLICRSPRYQSAHVWFESNKYNFRDKAIFVGLEKEHDHFQWTFGINIPFHKTNNALELARVIAGSKAFVSNQTFALSVAIGLGTVSIVQETDKIVPNCTYKYKRNMNYI